MRRSWSVADFFLVWLGGVLGAGVFLGVGLVYGSTEWLIVAGFAGQYLGSLGVLWLLRTRREVGELGFVVESGDVLFIGLGLILQVSLALLLLPLAERLFPDGRPPQQVVEALAELDGSTAVKVTIVLAAVVLAPVTEELIFRGVLLRALARRGRVLATIVTATAFAAVHLLGLDPDRLLASSAVVLPPLFILGVLLAWITFRTRRLGPAIFIHSGWNLLTVLVLLLPTELFESLS